MANQKTTPSNKKTDESELYNFIKDSPSGVMSPEVADEFDIAGSTARTALSQLVDSGKIQKRTVGRYNIYYTDTDPDTNIFGDITILEPSMKTYLETGDPGNSPETHQLDEIANRLDDSSSNIPFNDGPKKADLTLIADRLNTPVDELVERTPQTVRIELTSIADELRVPADALFTRTRTATSDELSATIEWIDMDQSELLEQLSNTTSREASEWSGVIESLTETQSPYNIRKDIEEVLIRICRDDVLGPRSEWAIEKQ